jgi:hypothetical protein
MKASAAIAAALFDLSSTVVIGFMLNADAGQIFE